MSETFAKTSEKTLEKSLQKHMQHQDSNTQNKHTCNMLLKNN